MAKMHEAICELLPEEQMQVSVKRVREGFLRPIQRTNLFSSADAVSKD